MHEGNFLHHAVAQAEAQRSHLQILISQRVCKQVRRGLRRQAGVLLRVVADLQPARVGVELHVDAAPARGVAQRVFNQVAQRQAQQHGMARQGERAGAR